MDILENLLERLHRLSHDPRNQYLNSLWQSDISPTYDSADFFRGIPATGQILCLASLPYEEWNEVLPEYDLRKYYTDPEYYLECYLRKYLYYFEQLQDDRPIRRSIPVFQNTVELSLFGAETVYYRDRNPWIAGAVIHRPEDLDRLDLPDFYNSGLMPLVHDFYERIRELVGDAFGVTFPRWRLGLFSTAMHLRGTTDFLYELVVRPDFAHRLMEFVTESRLHWERQRAEFLGEPIPKVCLGNDDVCRPMISPDLYLEFVHPYEQKLVNHGGGLLYWHSCGDYTELLPLIRQLGPVELVELATPWTDLGQVIDTFPGTPLEIMVHPEVGMSTDATRIRASTTRILQTCRRHRAETFFITGGGYCGSYWFRVVSQMIRQHGRK